MKEDFDQLDPESRRLILVASDAKYQELASQIDWMAVTKGVLAALGGTYLAPIALIPSLFGTSLAGSAYLAGTWAAFKRVKSGESPDLFAWAKKGGIPIPHLSPSEASRRFRFDPGDPKDGAAYLLDPCIPDHYLAPAIANERLAQDKCGAFMQIAAALGAKKLELVSGESLATSAGGSVDAPLEEAAAQIGLGVGFDSDHKVIRQVFVEFDEPDRPPYLPSELQAWTNVDPSLRALVNMRLNARPRTAKVKLNFENTVDIDAKATAELEARKIGVGGKYRQVKASSWSFDVEFWPARGR